MTKPEPLVFVGYPEISYEDGAQALILEVTSNFDSENGTFVRVQSWDTKKKHLELTPFMGRELRVTVEVVDTPEENISTNEMLLDEFETALNTSEHGWGKEAREAERKLPQLRAEILRRMEK